MIALKALPLTFSVTAGKKKKTFLFSSKKEKKNDNFIVKTQDILF